MYDLRRMCSVLWMDKQAVLLLSTHAPSEFPRHPNDCTVLRRDSAMRLNICTSLVVQEYMEHMRGVDVVDHLRENYSSQVQLHKWWHRVFFFLWDLTKVNMYMMYLEILKRLEKLDEAITHL